MITFGKFIKDMRIKQGISGRKFALSLKKAPSYIHDIENGKRNAPSRDILEQMIIELKLNAQDTDKFYDLAKVNKATPIAEDVIDIVVNNKDIPLLCRRIYREKIDTKYLLRMLDSLVSK